MRKIKRQSQWERLEKSVFNYELILDKNKIGTVDYKGYAYFWAYKYRYDLRATTPNIRRQIHKQFLKEGLLLHGETSRHDEIINKKIKTNEHRKRMYDRFGSSEGSSYKQD